VIRFFGLVFYMMFLVCFGLATAFFTSPKHKRGH
jgi:hypothetical protein